jgi:molybdopterin adenylyltransferase
VNISTAKGTAKTPVPSARLIEGFGMESDAHAGKWHRQISLLGREDIDAMIAAGAVVDNGAFAENITTRGIDLAALPIGTRLDIGEAQLEITQIGKECHARCAIYQSVGDCVMPRRGVFARVIKGGTISHESIGRYDF